MPTPKLRLAVVTTHPPGKGSLNEYAYHFVRFLRQKEEISEVILLPDDLLQGESYAFEDKPGSLRELACAIRKRLDAAA